MGAGRNRLSTIFASVLAISIVPTILLSPFGGVLADRVNRRTIMVALDAISAVLVTCERIVSPPRASIS